MNALSQAHRAYSAATSTTRTTRGTEYEAVARITTRMKTAYEKGPTGFTALAEALHDNRKLWNIFAVDVADAGNTLPKDLKARLFYLAEFTNHHTSKVLARKASVAPLLEVNTAIMRGLRSGTT
ncbi:flagellar biosynthesis regulator FlaF [Rhodobacteraceae bacterium F11138]|nr:flagellar biosynthesis regulator FlaF [Rhodobacteraceae bacterium F11138]